MLDLSCGNLIIVNYFICPFDGFIAIAGGLKILSLHVRNLNPYHKQWCQKIPIHSGTSVPGYGKESWAIGSGIDSQIQKDSLNKHSTISLVP